MVDFGVAKSRRARFSYLGHRVRGNVTKKNKEETLKTGGGLASKVAQIKAGLNTEKRLQSLSKQERKARFFNFDEDEDEDDVMLKGGSDGPISVGKASRKNILDSLKDDFEESGLILSDDEQEDRQLNPLLTRALQFGEGGDAGGDSKARAKTRREKLQEVIKKNKVRKAQHAHNVYEQSSLLEEADSRISEVIKDLDFKPTRESEDFKSRAAEEAIDAELADIRTKAERARDDDFDNLMQTLAHQPKARPGERKLTLAERNERTKRQRKLAESRMLEDIRRGKNLNFDDEQSESTQESSSDDSSASEDDSAADSELDRSED